MNQNEFARSFTAFRAVSESKLKELLSASSRKKIPAGTQLYREGDACSAIAFVLSGDIRVFKIGQTGREITLYEIGPGETCILNASCILAGKSYPANAVTLSETELVLIPSPSFQKMMAESEQMRAFIFTVLSQRMTAVMELVEEVAFGRMDQRLLDYLTEKSADGVLETTHQKIANDLGTSREVVSRLLKDFERRKEVRLSRNSITLLTGIGKQ
jgi:CRP/FNR family transcriptional regulator